LKADAWLWKYAGPTPASTERLPMRFICCALARFCCRLVLPAFSGSAAPMTSWPRIFAAWISASQFVSASVP